MVYEDFPNFLKWQMLSMLKLLTDFEGFTNTLMMLICLLVAFLKGFVYNFLKWVYLFTITGGPYIVSENFFFGNFAHTMQGRPNVVVYHVIVCLQTSHWGSRGSNFCLYCWTAIFEFEKRWSILVRKWKSSWWF